MKWYLDTDLTATRVGELKRALAGLAEVASFYKHSSDPLPPEGSDDPQRAYLCAQLHERIQQANELIKMLAGWHDPKSWRVPATSRELDPCGRGAGIEPDDLPEIPVVTIPKAESDRQLAELNELRVTVIERDEEIEVRKKNEAEWRSLAGNRLGELRKVRQERDAAQRIASEYLESAQDYAKEVAELRRELENQRTRASLAEENWAYRTAEVERLENTRDALQAANAGLIRERDAAKRQASEWLIQAQDLTRKVYSLESALKTIRKAANVDGHELENTPPIGMSGYHQPARSTYEPEPEDTEV